MENLSNYCLELEEQWKNCIKKDGNKEDIKGCRFLPLTELAVDITNELAPDGLGKIDMFAASDLLRSCSKHSSSPLLLGLLYARRWHQRQRELAQRQSCSSAELFLVSMMVASKYLYDEGTPDDVFNDEWATEFPGMDTEDINSLEADFLTSSGWNFYVQPSEYGEWLRELELRLAERIAQKREWRTTFTEMALLLSSRDIQKGARTALRLLAEAVALCTLVYSCALLSVFFSAAVLHSAQPILRVSSTGPPEATASCRNRTSVRMPPTPVPSPLLPPHVSRDQKDDNTSVIFRQRKRKAPSCCGALEMERHWRWAGLRTAVSQ